jgi:hypothetical protein
MGVVTKSARGQGMDEGKEMIESRISKRVIGV